MAKTNKNLKAALQSQQSRLKNKQKAAQAVQAAEQKLKKKGQPNRDAKGKSKAAPITLSTLRPTIPFHPTDKILLIGEGNFSFARALVVDPLSELAFLPPGNITATAYDTEDQCYDKYPEAREIVAEIVEKGVEVLFGIDATRLEKGPKFKSRSWDRIVWNFPHAGLCGCNVL